MGLGTAELFLLAVIAVMFLGPKEVYKIAHKMGRWVREIQKMSQEFMRELNREADAIERSEQTTPADKNVFMTGSSATPTPTIPSASPHVSDDNPVSILNGGESSEAIAPVTLEAPVALEPAPASAAEPTTEGPVVTEQRSE